MIKVENSILGNYNLLSYVKSLAYSFEEINTEPSEPHPSVQIQ